MTDRTATDIAERVEQVLERIHRAATSAGRDPAAITLVAVTKTHGRKAIEAAYAAGLREFGENRVEEAEEKLPGLAHLSDSVWHMIGHVQSRKAAPVAALFAHVHSVDRVKIAQRLSRAALEAGRLLDVLIEANVSGEESKYGFDLSGWPASASQFDNLAQAVEEMLALPNLRVGGLMTMAPRGGAPESARPIFSRLARLRDGLAQRFPQMKWTHLSMGMTADFEVAVQEGATMVRIGTAIFGPRHT